MNMAPRSLKQEARRQLNQLAEHKGLEGASGTPRPLSEVEKSSKAQAFQLSGLDANNSTHAEFLLGVFAGILLPRKLAGHPRRWTPQKEKDLFLRFLAARKRRHPKRSDTLVCDELRKSYPNDYGKMSTPGLRRRHSECRWKAYGYLYTEFFLEVMYNSAQSLRSAPNPESSEQPDAQAAQ